MRKTMNKSTGWTKAAVIGLALIAVSVIALTFTATVTHASGGPAYKSGTIAAKGKRVPASIQEGDRVTLPFGPRPSCPILLPKSQTWHILPPGHRAGPIERDAGYYTDRVAAGFTINGI